MTKHQNDMDETNPSPEPIGRQRAIRVDVPTNLDNIRVILLEPREPGNIGSAARALKGMGLSQLYLVNPVPFLEAKPTWYMAHGATDVIENCCVVRRWTMLSKGFSFSSARPIGGATLDCRPLFQREKRRRRLPLFRSISRSGCYLGVRISDYPPPRSAAAS